MSWDVLLFCMDRPPQEGTDLPHDWTPPAIDAERFRRMVSEAFPDTDWSGQGRGLLLGPDWSVEFDLGPDDLSPTTVSLSLRGGEGAFAVVERMMASPGWYAMDMGSGTWLHHMDRPDAAFSAFREFRDTALTKPAPSPSPTGLVGRLRQVFRI